MDRVVYMLFPDMQARTGFMYGSQIETGRQGEGLHYVNRLAMPGQTLLHWQSFLDSEDPFSQPTLPLPERKAKIWLRSFMKIQEKGDYYLQAEYLDRDGNVLDEQIIESQEDLLEVPEEAYHWLIRLVQAGTGALWFHHIELVNVKEEEDWNQSAKYTDAPCERVCFLIPELAKRTNHLPDISAYSEEKKLYTVPLLLTSCAALPADLCPGGREGLRNVQSFIRNRVQKETLVILRTFGPISFACAENVEQKLRQEKPKVQFQVIWEQKKKGLAGI